jgi:hypothetical protein
MKIYEILIIIILLVSISINIFFFFNNTGENRTNKDFAGISNNIKELENEKSIIRNRNNELRKISERARNIITENRTDLSELEAINERFRKFIQEN